MKKLLVATHNQDKLTEYRALLADLPLNLTLSGGGRHCL